MSEYRLTPEAGSDLFEIWSYIARDSTEHADLVEEAIYRNCSDLAKRPRMGHRRGDLTSRDVLFWPALPYRTYLIVYKPNSNPVEVLRIVHGARREAWRVG